jgi:hypothetical protein
MLGEVSSRHGLSDGDDVKTISINRAPVLTLWAAVVAQRLGFAEDEALTLGKAVAGLNAQSKGRRLGIFKPHEEKPPRRTSLANSPTTPIPCMSDSDPASQQARRGGEPKATSTWG